MLDLVTRKQPPQPTVIGGVVGGEAVESSLELVPAPPPRSTPTNLKRRASGPRTVLACLAGRVQHGAVRACMVGLLAGSMLTAPQATQARQTTAQSETQTAAAAGIPPVVPLDTIQRQKLETIHAALGPEGQALLDQLSATQRDGIPILLDGDLSEGGILLDHLLAITDRPIAKEFGRHGISRVKLLTALLDDLVHPTHISQFHHGTCTATSASYALARSYPAEYARLIAGLVSPSGRFKLAGGERARRVADAIAPDKDEPTRTVTQRLTQSAFIEYGNGPDKTYSNVLDANFSHGKAEGPGLETAEERRMIEGVFGEKFSPIRRKDFKDGADFGERLLETLKKRNGVATFIGLTWRADKSGLHALVFERVEKGRVIFWNPQGAQGDSSGTEYKNPPRILDSAPDSQESMSEAEFKAWVADATLPTREASHLRHFFVDLPR